MPRATRSPAPCCDVTADLVWHAPQQKILCEEYKRGRRLSPPFRSCLVILASLGTRLKEEQDITPFQCPALHAAERNLLSATWGTRFSQDRIGSDFKPDQRPPHSPTDQHKTTPLRQTCAGSNAHRGHIAIHSWPPCFSPCLFQPGLHSATLETFESKRKQDALCSCARIEHLGHGLIHDKGNARRRHHAHEIRHDSLVESGHALVSQDLGRHVQRACVISRPRR